jgi:hypothetical protein
MKARMLSLTQDEWAALLALVDLAEPPGVMTIDRTAPADADRLASGARSLVGRGLVNVDLDASDDDLHPFVVALLNALFDAEETVSVTVAYSGVLTSCAWYAIGDTGIVFLYDEFANLKFEIAPLADVVERATGFLSSLTPTLRSSSQLPLEVASLWSMLSTLTEGGTPSLAIGTQSRRVDSLGAVTGWVRHDSESTEETVMFVALPDGHWTVDADGSDYSLSQLKSPWPQVLRQFAPLAIRTRPS